MYYLALERFCGAVAGAENAEERLRHAKLELATADHLSSSPRL